MSQKFERLKTLLKELFQLDQPDLDFGLYRIMHAKSAEVTQFLDQHLLPQVKDAFALHKSADKSEIEKELAKVVAGVQAAGLDPEQSPKVKELRAKLKTDSVDVGALESEVYDHLYSFFRRYYSEGDFLSRRVYKPGVYAIPYEGEEVKFHWANADQYYIKTSEYLRDYAFRLRPDDEKRPMMRVHFRLVDAAEGEHGNVKEAQGKERRFKLADTDPVALADGELSIRFTYQPDPAKQKDLNAAAEIAILAVKDPALLEWLHALRAPHVRADGTEAGTRLRVHLDRYTARNTFDYFIHKDLGGFLRRELDFYIKNEVMHLDDVENESAPRVEQYLSKLRVIRRIASKIIDFLEQLEEFQKKLWLKRKFVTSVSYRISLDLIDEQHYAAIAKSEAQREEWVRLFAVDQIQGYTAPMSPDFLKANKTLLVDTQHLPDEIVSTIIDKFQDHDGVTNGLLVHSDNFHALRLIGKRYADSVRCIYIDPPYNTDVSAIPYKNDYRHSSFASLIQDRAALIRPLLETKGVLFVSIDKHERTTVEFALDAAFGQENRVEELIWVQNTNDGRSPTYSVNHEYVEVYARHKPSAEADIRIFREPKPGYVEVMAIVHQLEPGYPSVEEIQRKIRELYKAHQHGYREAIEAQGLEWQQEQRNDPWNGIYQYKFAEYRDHRGKYVDEDRARERGARIWVFRESDWTIMSAEDKQSESVFDKTHPNYRFYQPSHPLTGKPCAMPSRGWKGTQFVDPKHPERNSWESLSADHRIAFGPDETKVPQQKRMLHEVETNVAKTVFADYSDGEKETAALFGRPGVFLAPKHTNFVRRFIRQVADRGGTVLDCFGGSGSTAHAVIKENREEELSLKYVLIEANYYFDGVLVPRVMKGVYSSQWVGGKPVIRDGLRQCLKVMRLESYEDALNNLDMKRTETQATLLDTLQSKSTDGLREQYLLRYMLEVEARGSQSLLNLEAFADPMAYKLKVKRPGSDESREVNVDLIETFNWLIGLTVKHIAAPRTFAATFERDGEGCLKIKDRLRQHEKGRFWFRFLTGMTPEGKRTLVVWRKLTGKPEEDNLVLDAWFSTQQYSPKDSEFDLIYVNGGNNLENLKGTEERWKVQLIEENFHRLMFETDGA